MIAWFIIQGLLINYPLWTRSLPPEVDDAYSYIVKAVQMEDCFLQDCSALDDLREQLKTGITTHSITPDKGKRFFWDFENISKPIYMDNLFSGIPQLSYRIYFRLFTIYHPLYSTIQLGINSVIDSWVLTHKITSVLGYLFIGAGVTYFLISIWGPVIAGISLLLLSIQIFPDQGLHYIVPSNLSLGIALFVLGRIIRRNGYAPYALMVGAASMITMHTIGFIYSGMAILISIILSYGSKFNKGKLASYILTAIIAVTYYSLRYLVDSPDFGLVSFPGDSGHIQLSTIIDSFRRAFHVFREFTRPYGLFSISEFADYYGGLFLSICLAVIGYLVTNRSSMDHKRRLRILYVISAICLFSLFYVVNYRPIALFTRLSILPEIIVIGYMSQSISWLWSLWRSRQNSLVKIGILVFGLYMIVTLFSGVQGILEHMTAIYKRHNYSYNLGQPRIVQRLSSHRNKILYNDEYVLPFYLSHGAINQNALYALKNQKTADIAYFVRRHPITSLSIAREGMIPSISFKSMSVDFDEPLLLEMINIKVRNVENDARLSFLPFNVRNEQLGKIHVTIPSKYSGTITVPISINELISKIVLNISEESFVWIAGITFDNTNLSWPWTQKATISFTPNNGNYYDEYFPFFPPVSITDKEQRVSFDLSDHVSKNLVDRKSYVLDDKGFSVLIKCN
ncbi:MAG TPA: hypothetical protein DHN29_03845 [Cytophagales bacterium]|nr:hypothetical protein [Cytophagales bacterium]